MNMHMTITKLCARSAALLLIVLSVCTIRNPALKRTALPDKDDGIKTEVALILPEQERSRSHSTKTSSTSTSSTSVLQAQTPLSPMSPMQGFERRATETFFPEVFQLVNILGPPDFNTDRYGYGIALNGDGSRVAVAMDRNNGEVRIYDDADEVTGWRMIGQIITETNSADYDGDQFGQGLAMNADGTRIAIGAPKATIGDAPSTTTGAFYIYDDNGQDLAWTQIYASENDDMLPMKEDADVGWSVSMTAAGDKIIVGCPGVNGNRGTAKFLGVSGNTVTLLGDFNEGENPDERVGTSVSISESGSYSIVGSPGNKNVIVRIGDPNDADPCLHYQSSPTSSNLSFGDSVAINEDGIFIVGDKGYGTVTAFRISDCSSVVLSTTLDGTDKTNFGSSVSIASTGRIAVGSDFSVGSVDVYKMSVDTSGLPTGWELEDTIEMESAPFGSGPLAMTADGLRIAVGSPQYNENLGLAAVFWDIDPSHEPSLQPSDEPSQQPSQQPSDEPSQQPSRQPSDQPSQQPSRQPSHHPSDQPSQQPSRLPSVSPTTSRNPSIAPSKQPTTVPSTSFSPSVSDQPTALPSIAPTTSRMPSDTPSSKPSEFRLCFDSTTVDCSWVSQNTNGRCPMFSGLSDGTYMFEHCRKTCGKCVCMDDPDWRGDFQWKTCKYVSKKPYTRCLANRVPGAKESCMKTCSTAKECCKNNPEFRYKNDSRKDCQWVARNQSDLRCSRADVAVNCPIACSRCNYDDYLTDNEETSFTDSVNNAFDKNPEELNSDDGKSSFPNIFISTSRRKKNDFVFNN